MAKGEYDDEIRRLKVFGPLVKWGVIGIVFLIVAFIVIGGLYSVVPKGYYQVSQQWFTGKVDAKMQPGLWFPIGDTEDWPKAITYFFTATKDHKEDTNKDASIEVRFNDGSLCKISGTIRVLFPTSKAMAMHLVTEQGYTTPEDVMSKLVLPRIRDSLRTSANLMSARQSYSEKRPDFVSWSWNQIQNGTYQTQEKWMQVEDPVSGEKVNKYIKVIKKDKDGNAIHQENPLKGTGIRLANFEVKRFVYSKKVAEQIAKQQEAIMAVETARAAAQKAEQDKLTAQAEGEAAATTAKWQKEKEKVQAEVEAEKAKRVAEIKAEQELRVAEFSKKAAAETKDANILIAQGEAEARRLKMQADNYAKLKIDAFREVQLAWADAFKTRKVPQTVLGGGNGSTDKEFMTMNQALQLLSMKALGVNLGINSGPTTVVQTK